MDDGPIPITAPSGYLPLRLRDQAGDRVLELDRPDMVAGRHSEADVRLNSPDVSRRHCRFVASNDGWEIIDLGSLNGVFVNGVRRPRAILQIGDIVRIAGLEFEVEPTTPEVEVLRRIAETLPAPGEPPQRRAS